VYFLNIKEHLQYPSFVFDFEDKGVDYLAQIF